MKKITLIGAGNMGMAIYHGLVSQWAPETITVCDRHPSKLEQMDSKCSVTTSVEEAVSGADTVILAVKPAAFAEAVAPVTDALQGTLLISVMAGITLQQLRESTSAQRIVRAMPNLPVQVGEGVVAWMATDDVAAEERNFVVGLFLPVARERFQKNMHLIAGL